MNSYEMDEDQIAGVAEALGLEVEDLEGVQYRLDAHESDDGVLYGYNVYFEPGSDPAVLAQIPGLVNNEWVRIGPF